MGEPGVEQLVEGAALCLDNSERLLKEIVAIGDDHLDVCSFLLMTVCEEIGKAFGLLHLAGDIYGDFAMRVDAELFGFTGDLESLLDEVQSWEAFYKKRFKDHPTKLAQFRSSFSRFRVLSVQEDSVQLGTVDFFAGQKEKDLVLAARRALLVDWDHQKSKWCVPGRKFMLNPTEIAQYLLDDELPELRDQHTRTKEHLIGGMAEYQRREAHLKGLPDASVS